MVDLPAPEVGALDVPPPTLGVRGQDERALACTNQYPYSAHPLLLPELASASGRAPPSDYRRWTGTSIRGDEPPRRVLRMGPCPCCIVERAGPRSTGPASQRTAHDRRVGPLSILAPPSD